MPDNDKLTALIAAFLQRNPRGTTDRACYAIERVRQFHRLRDTDALLARLELLEAESRTVSLVRLPAVQFLDAYYQAAVVGIMPMAREGLRTILNSAEAFIPTPRGH